MSKTISSAAAALPDGSIFEDRLRQGPVVIHVDDLAAREEPFLATPTTEQAEALSGGRK